MKKYLALAFVPLFFGCASHQPLELEQENVVLPEIQVCSNEQEAPREIKHPRITETVLAKPSRRACCTEQAPDCHDENTDSFRSHCPSSSHNGVQKEESKPVTYIPAQPEAYALLANRVFNNFIKDTYDIYSENPNLKIYIKEPVLKADDLPSGYEKGIEVFKTQLQNSYVYRLTDDENEADYTLSTTIDWFDTPSKDVPAIRYVVDLNAKDETNAGSWSEIVKKADNKSWL